MMISERLRQHLPRGTKNMYRGLVLGAKGLRRGTKVLPEFLVIGAQKSATSTLAAALASHPQICSSLFKEAHYFDLNYDRGTAWYARHFPKAKVSSLMTFESTPYYLFHPQVPRRVYQFKPEMKLIVSLRDPVARAYSHYQMERRRGYEPLSRFEEAIDQEESRIGVDMEHMADGKITSSLAVQRHSYLRRGYYQEQLDRWLAVFPRERLFAIDYDQLKSEPLAVLSKLANFLGVKNQFTLPRPRMVAGPHQPLEDRLKRRLRLHFQEQNAGLENMLDMKFDWLR